MTNSDLQFPSEEEVVIARNNYRTLNQISHDTVTNKVVFSIEGEESERTLRMSQSMLQLMLRMMRDLAEGNAVQVIPVHAQLTTQQAADLLNVSRPYLVGLLELEVIPHRKVGSHRRVLAEDVIKYKNDIDAKRIETLAELSEYEQELGLE